MRTRPFAIATIAVTLLLNGCQDSAPPADTSTTIEAALADLVANSPAMPEADISADTLFASPFIDIDEWRDEPVRHRYVHGGFADTDTRFSFYFPPADAYQGRFFQHITPVPDSENLAQNEPAGTTNKVQFAIASGGYFVETNGGGKFDLGTHAQRQFDPTISAYRANAAAARYSRVIANALFGDGRVYGYAYGGSGGGYRTIGAAENTQGVWDGFVPYVIGSSMAIPNSFTARLQALRVLRDRFDGIVDAVDAGGSGNPYAGLTEIEAEALAEVTAMGFPLPAWYGYKRMGLHGFAALYGGVVMADPDYFARFWDTPGYLGHDDPARFESYRIQFSSTVAEPITAAEAARARININASSERERGDVDTAFMIPEGAEGERIVGYRLSETPPDIYFLGGDLNINSGAFAGRSLPLARIVDDIIILGYADTTVAEGIATGDQVTVDNSNFLAIETYHRHQVPGPDFPVWDHWRNDDGSPKYPQQARLIGPGFVMATSGSMQNGGIHGKMIVVSSLLDREAYPWQADWYRRQVEARLGDQTDSQFRLWFTDRALHGDVDHSRMDDRTQVVSYLGMLHQALRDVARWAEQGIAPPSSTSYAVEQGQVIVAPNAAQRLGVQPTVELGSESGQKRIEARVGEPVELVATISVPPGTGFITGIEWHTGDHEGDYLRDDTVTGSEASLKVTHSHRFSAPGTYFVTLRARSERNGNQGSPFAQLYNLDRARVVVTE